MVMNGTAGAVRAVRMIRRLKELRGKACGTDLKGKRMVRCGHETRRHERTGGESEQHNAGNQLAAPSM